MKRREDEKKIQNNEVGKENKNNAENEEVKSYIRISFDHFTPSKNPHFRDCIVEIDIICHPEY